MISGYVIVSENGKTLNSMMRWGTKSGWFWSREELENILAIFPMYHTFYIENKKIAFIHEVQSDDNFENVRIINKTNIDNFIKENDIIYIHGRLINIDGRSYDVSKIKTDKFENGIEILFVSYGRNVATFENLNRLSKFFGTKSIDMNNSIHEDGCETCGHGECDKQTVQIYNITKNYPF